MPRVTFTNLRTVETVEMPFVPEKFDEMVEVVYARLRVLGLSHEVLHYVGTDNHKFDGFDLFFRGESPDQVAAIHDGRAFLLSLCYAPSGVTGVRDGAPPRVLFVWPQMVSMTCVITRVRISHERFNRIGMTTEFRATIDLEEIRDVRLTSEDVRAFATARTSRGPEES